MDLSLKERKKEDISLQNLLPSCDIVLVFFFFFCITFFKMDTLSNRKVRWLKYTRGLGIWVWVLQIPHSRGS